MALGSARVPEAAAASAAKTAAAAAASALAAPMCTESAISPRLTRRCTATNRSVSHGTSIAPRSALTLALASRVRHRAALGTAPIKANAAGAWTYTLTAAELQAMGQGGETLSVVTRDAADNDSAPVTRLVTIDTEAPATAPVISQVVDDVGNGSFTGALAPSATTNDQTLTLTGTASGTAAGDRVVVFDGATRLGEASVEGGSWTFTTPNLSNAAHSLTARVVDPAGNQGPASTAFALTVNVTPPAASAAVTGFRVGETNATALQGAVTNDTSPAVAGTVTGTLAQDDVVVVYDGAVRLGAATVAQGGATWHFDTAGLADGAHAFSAVVESASGVQGARGSAVSLSIDTVAPAAPTISVVAGNDVINNIERLATTVSGTAEAKASVALAAFCANVLQAVFAASALGLAAGARATEAPPTGLVVGSVAPGVAVVAESGADLTRLAHLRERGLGQRGREGPEGVEAVTERVERSPPRNAPRGSPWARCIATRCARETLVLAAATCIANAQPFVE
jgi:hypothetical protein